MKLPNAELALIEEGKIREYLLNARHSYGASKARFLTGFGFSPDEWEVLRDALHEHGRNHEVTKVKETPFGPRYEIEGSLIAPDGRRPRLCTVWQVDKGQIAPRLLTAYPLHAL